MSYVISIDDNTYNMVDCLHDSSADFSLFSEGVSLRELNFYLIYKAKNKSSFNKLKNLHVIFTTIKWKDWSSGKKSGGAGHIFYE